MVGTHLSKEQEEAIDDALLNLLSALNPHIKQKDVDIKSLEFACYIGKQRRKAFTNKILLERFSATPGSAWRVTAETVSFND